MEILSWEFSMVSLRILKKPLLRRDVRVDGKKPTTLRAAFSAVAEGRTVSESSRNAQWVCQSPSMRGLDEQISHAARVQHAVLLTGESGTGKTTVAQIIHERSKHSAARFVDVNCAALPEHLLESELFGFERGAFTGATGRKKGLFEVAHNGTLFLDEIGELKPELQAKLLKAIDCRKIRRLGGLTDIDCNVRLVAASSRNLHRMIAVGSFRDDLYYRLAVLQLDIPPLRQRRQDIPELVFRRFAAERSELSSVKSVQLDEAALNELCLYDWPGNIRQLQNVIARLACYAGGTNVTAANVHAELARFKYLDSQTIDLPDSCRTLFAGESFHDFTQRVRAAAIEAVKRRYNGNMSHAARRLKLDRSSLFKITRGINAHCHSRADNTSECATSPSSHSQEP